MSIQVSLILSIVLLSGCVHCHTLWRERQGEQDNILGKKIRNLQDSFSKIQEKLAQQNRTIAKQNAKILELHLQNTQLRKEMTRLSALGKGERNSSFLAVSNMNQTVSPGATVHFARLMHNNAPEFFGYDTALSTFRCPYDGLYVFYFNVVTNRVSSVNQFSIVLETNFVVSSYTTTGSYSPSLAMSALGVTNCLKGQNVRVVNTLRFIGTGDLYVYGDYTGSSHFAGFQLN